QGLVGALRELLPEGQRAQGPAGVDLLASVAHADHAGLAAGAGPAVARAVGVEERDLPARSDQVEGGPGSEHPGPDPDCRSHGSQSYDGRRPLTGRVDHVYFEAEMSARPAVRPEARVRRGPRVQRGAAV